MRKLSLVAIVGMLLAVSTGVAAAATATLTPTEYQELTALQNVYAGTKSLKSVAGLEAARRHCQQISPVSALMRAERADCNAAFQWLGATVKAVLKLKPCSKQKTVNGRFSCLLPVYARIKATISAMYRAEKRLYNASVARGFGHTCVLALGDGSKAIAAEGRMTSDISKMVSAMRHRNLLVTQKLGSLYDAATAEMEAAASKVSVSACPHQ
jgi:hypothetical protein